MENSIEVIKDISQILDFIDMEIPFNKFKKNGGIFETNAIKNKDITIGVSYETDDNEEDIYVYNIFIGSEYINISSTGNKDNKTPISVVDEIRNAILEI